MRIIEYENTENVDPTDLLVLDSAENGTRNIYADKFARNILELGGTKEQIASILLSLSTQSNQMSELSNRVDNVDANVSLINAFTRPTTIAGTSMQGNDTIFLVSGRSTKAVAANEMLYGLIDTVTNNADTVANGAIRKVMFRGKNLGSSFTDTQKEAVRSGKFTDLFLGDYWTIGGHDWIIADFNYWYMSFLGTENLIPHLVIIPRNNLYNARMHSSNTTEGGYKSSEMHTTNLNQARTLIDNCFGGNHVLNKKVIVCNVKNGMYIGGSATNEKVHLMTELQVLGTSLTANHLGYGPTDRYFFTNYADSNQLAIFKATPSISNGVAGNFNAFWTRDVADTQKYVAINNYFHTGSADATAGLGVRPIFALNG